FFIAMDNCRIRYSHYVIGAIQSRGYKPLFMLIEECWSKIKAHARRNPFSSLDTLTPRIQAACRSVATGDCLG
ncbi:hypothetical protein BCV72DRAFT_211811, partial [Rhizopus microsporus var. microsporus]